MSTTRVARKRHTCAVCGHTIQPGDRYLYQAPGVNRATCARCAPRHVPELDIGRLLNTATPAGPCPNCHKGGPLLIHEHAVVWACCGHQRPLRPLPHAAHRPTPRTTATAHRTRAGTATPSSH